jgi:predicted Zn-dependent protease
MIDRYEQIDALVRRHCQADDFSLSMGVKDSHGLRFAQNAATQHMVGNEARIALNVSFGDRSGSAASNQTSEEDILRLIRTAEETARCSQPDPEFMPSVGPQELPQTSDYCAPTEELSGAEMVETVRKCIEFAQGKEAVLSGMIERHLHYEASSTRNGFRGAYSETVFSHSMTMKKNENETKVSQALKDYGQFRIDDLIAQLDDQYTSLTDRKPLEPGRIPVILRPAAVLDLFAFMTYYMRRREADEGLTCFSGQIGKPLFGERFSMLSSFTQADLSASPYSYDLTANRETAWVDKGVLRELPTPRYWAQKQGYRPSTVFNLYIPGENATEEEMMRMAPRGVIVNRLWYIRSVDQRIGEYTGITRDGVVYFEDGKIRHAVNNMRFNEIPHDCARRILAMGPSLLIDNQVKAPTMLVDDFNFVDVTTF